MVTLTYNDETAALVIVLLRRSRLARALLVADDIERQLRKNGTHPDAFLGALGPTERLEVETA